LTEGGVVLLYQPSNYKAYFMTVALHIYTYLTQNIDKYYESTFLDKNQDLLNIEIYRETFIEIHKENIVQNVLILGN
jgi:hypothetical protein